MKKSDSEAGRGRFASGTGYRLEGLGETELALLDQFSADLANTDLAARRADLGRTMRSLPLRSACR